VSLAACEVIAVRALTKVYASGARNVEVLRGIDLAVSAGEFLAIMGPSGSGKSTLLHLIAGLDAPTAGTIQVGGEDIGALGEEGRTLLRGRRIGVIFQAFHLLDTLCAEENVSLPLAIRGWPAAEAKRRARRALERVGMGHRRKHLPRELSGGEQQRVAIARALVADPLILLADEPTGNLDTANSGQILALLRGLVDESRQTLLLVTHDCGQAALADRLILLRDGRVVAEQFPRRGLPQDQPVGAPDEALDLHISGVAAPAGADAAHGAGDCPRCGGQRGHRPGYPHRPPGLPEPVRGREREGVS
jgi:putative ABC transport system ATP-binding protein